MFALSMRLSIYIVAVLQWVYGVHGSGKIVNYLSGLSKDSAVNIGRGYSDVTSSGYSSCFDIEKSVTALKSSYDYKLSVLQNTITSSGIIHNIEETLSHREFGNLLANEHAPASAGRSLQIMIVSIEVDRYYLTLDDLHSELTTNAATLLRGGDIISFFQACGPTYIRTIRRGAVLSALLRWLVDTDPEKMQQASGNLGFRVKQITVDDSTASFSEIASLDISVIAQGLDLSPDGQAGNGINRQNLVVSSIDDMNRLVNYGLTAMQNADTGIVTSIELLRWTSNIKFAALVDLDTSDTLQTSRGKLVVRKMNIIANAEHVARISNSLRQKIASAGRIQTCLAKAMKYTDNFLMRNLVNKRCLGIDGCTEKTLEELQCELLGEVLPSDRLSRVEKNAEKYLYSRTLRQAVSYMENYFKPCVNRLSESADGVDMGTFRTHHWSSLPECRDITCTLEFSYWDEADQACRLSPEDDEIDILVSEFCMPKLEESISTEDFECPAPEKSDRFCREVVLEENPSNRINYWINSNYTGPSYTLETGAECSSCTGESFYSLEVNERANDLSSTCYPIEGKGDILFQSGWGVFPQASRTSFTVSGKTDANMTIVLHQNNCDCASTETQAITITEDCKISEDRRFCSSVEFLE